MPPLAAHSRRFARDPLRLRSGQALAPLVKARGFGMTPTKKGTLSRTHGYIIVPCCSRCDFCEMLRAIGRD
jgi:hypothetical protein